MPIIGIPSTPRGAVALYAWRAAGTVTALCVYGATLVLGGALRVPAFNGQDGQADWYGTIFQALTFKACPLCRTPA